MFLMNFVHTYGFIHKYNTKRTNGNTINVSEPIGNGYIDNNKRETEDWMDVKVIDLAIWIFQKFNVLKFIDAKEVLKLDKKTFY